MSVRDPMMLAYKVTILQVFVKVSQSKIVIPKTQKNSNTVTIMYKNTPFQKDGILTKWESDYA